MPQQLYPLIADVQGLSSPSAPCMGGLPSVLGHAGNPGHRKQIGMLFEIGILSRHIFVGGKEGGEDAELGGFSGFAGCHCMERNGGAVLA